jgi:hypothetical protein
MIPTVKRMVLFKHGVAYVERGRAGRRIVQPLVRQGTR